MHDKTDKAPRTFPGESRTVIYDRTRKEKRSFAQKIYNDVCRLIYECKEFSVHKEHVKFLILKDEKELYAPGSYMDAETLLKQEVFIKCNKGGWKEQMYISY